MGYTGERGTLGTWPETKKRRHEIYSDVQVYFYYVIILVYI
jgi:hypothetical protein